GGHFLEKVKDLQEVGSYLEMAICIARSHHEQYQGGGYPDGLVGDAIPLEARIVAVSDVYDALTSWRPYKEPWPEEKVFAFIRDAAGKLFDPKVVAAFFAIKEHRAATPVLGWTEAMSVGIPDLDNDHKGIIRLINEIDIVQKQFDSITVGLVLDELFNYTVRHFQREESFLRGHAFPDLLDHELQHGRFADQVADLRRRYLHKNQPEAANELMELMGRWLARHILVEDMKYARWLRTVDASRADAEENAGSAG
ncbi:MAG: bacteriohemerythrin, partial [Magnetococcales bacterium]|nr:bacteriohemerythrin [Magnetococcales bacterium]